MLCNIMSKSVCVCVCRYSGVWEVFRSIVRLQGVRGLWKGWAPNCQRAALVCLGGGNIATAAVVIDPSICCYIVLFYCRPDNI